MEHWRDINGYEGRYQVSDLGRVKSLPFAQGYLLKTGEKAQRVTREKILAQQRTNAGYMIVHLHKDNERKAFTVHRLVARAFIPGDALTVNHIDGNKTNNAAANLEWNTYTENLDHAVRVGLNLQAVKVVGTSLADGSTKAFDSQAQAALVITGKRSNGTKISACLVGKRKTAYGFKWAAL